MTTMIIGRINAAPFLSAMPDPKKLPNTLQAAAGMAAAHKTLPLKAYVIKEA